MEKLFSTRPQIMKHIVFSCTLLVCSMNVLAQTTESITLEECYSLATENYPLIKQKELLSRTRDYSLDNASKGKRPQITINSHITYQSDVTSLPFRPPGFEETIISRDQYRVSAEITQPLTEGSLIKQNQLLIQANTDVEEQRVEVELYQLKERVNQMYFGILLIRAQIEQIGLLRKDIQSGLDKANAAIAYGTALKSSADVLKAELLKSDQRMIELKSNLTSYIQMLGIMINKPIDENTDFQTPPVQVSLYTINRPELLLFDAEYNSFEAEHKILSARKTPQVGLFFQGGYGKPGLNFLNPNFDFYAIGGIRFSWSFTNFYTFHNDNQMVGLKQNMVEVQRESFLFNTNLSMKQQENDLKKYEELIMVDEKIVAIYENNLTSYVAQLENGTMTSMDYVTHVNDVDVARQNSVLHQTQLLMTQYNYKTTSGN